MTKLSLLYLPLLALVLQSFQVRASAGSSSLRRFLDGQDPSHACTADELVDYCPDTGVDQVDLVKHCLGEHGLNAAKCYMKYLCEHHNQEAVQKHKDCMDKECPLAKRMPPLDCETYLAGLGEATTDDSSNQNGEEEETTTEGETPDNNNNENNNEEEEEQPEDAEIEDTATVDEEPEETLIEEEVSVDNPREHKTNATQAAQTEAQAEEKPKKKHTGAKVFFFVVVPILAVLGFFALRGKKEIFPFDAHIESSNTNSLNLTTLTPNSNPNAQIT